MARFDLPACINYVLKVTNRSSLHYVGHSQGSVIGFIQFGHDLELGKKIKTFVALAPVATVGHVGGVVKLLKYASPYINVGVSCYVAFTLTFLTSDYDCLIVYGQLYCLGY